MASRRNLFLVMVFVFHKVASLFRSFLFLLIESFVKLKVVCLFVAEGQRFRCPEAGSGQAVEWEATKGAWKAL